jgi:hypothetical protein
MRWTDVDYGTSMEMPFQSTQEQQIQQRKTDDIAQLNPQPRQDQRQPKTTESLCHCQPHTPINYRDAPAAKKQGIQFNQNQSLRILYQGT